jgi:hypothetical protein
MKSTTEIEKENKELCSKNKKTCYFIKTIGILFVLTFIIGAFTNNSTDEAMQPKTNIVQKAPTKYNKPFEALKNFGAFEPVELSNNEYILYTSYFPQDNDYIVLEEAKRTFIYGIYLSFIHTNIQNIKIGVVPREVKTNKKHKYSFSGSIKKEDAIKIAKNLLHINNINELLGNQAGDIFLNDVPSNIFNKALFNDAGTPTLDVFFNELSKVTY